MNECEYAETELEALCSGKDINVVTFMDYIVRDGVASELELIENNVIEGTIEEEKVCVPDYANNAVTYINNLYNDENVRNKFGLIKDNTVDENMRYSGSIVQNYVEFGNAGELWRIIGIFDVETSVGDTEKLVKIVRDESFKDSNGNILRMAWDSSASSTNRGWGINEWSQSDLKSLLNGYYLGESASCTYCSASNQATCTNNCNNSITPISSTYRDMIESVVWNTGAMELKNVGISPLQAYSQERGNVTGKICTQGEKGCNDTVERTTEWEGKIGLIYPSDWGYAGSICTDITDYDCAQNNWAPNAVYHNCTITPVAYPDGVYSGFAYYVWNIEGSVYYREASSSFGVRPALYLKSNVKIVDGDGSKNNPYKLSK